MKWTVGMTRDVTTQELAVLVVEAETRQKALARVRDYLERTDGPGNPHHDLDWQFFDLVEFSDIQVGYMRPEYDVPDPEEEAVRQELVAEGVIADDKFLRELKAINDSIDAEEVTNEDD
jgi:hypothetical protein